MSKGDHIEVSTSIDCTVVLEDNGYGEYLTPVEIRVEGGWHEPEFRVFEGMDEREIEDDEEERTLSTMESGAFYVQFATEKETVSG